MYNSFEKPYRPQELASERKLASDKKNNTDSLTFQDSNNNNERAAAYKSIREFNDNKEIDFLASQTNEEAMLIELDLMERDFINE